MQIKVEKTIKLARQSRRKKQAKEVGRTANEITIKTYTKI